MLSLILSQQTRSNQINDEADMKFLFYKKKGFGECSEGDLREMKGCV
jgi:hypothetical protein